MPSLLKNLNALLDDRRAVASLAERIGGSEDDADVAVGPALARIIDGLATLAAADAGTVRYLIDHHGQPVADDLAEHIDRAPAASGNVILDRVFGAERGLVVIGLASGLGLAPSLVGRLLPVLSPLVAAEVATRRQTGELDEAAVAELLRAEQRAIVEAGLLEGTTFDAARVETARPGGAGGRRRAHRSRRGASVGSLATLAPRGHERRARIEASVTDTVEIVRPTVPTEPTVRTEPTVPAETPTPVEPTAPVETMEPTIEARGDVGVTPVEEPERSESVEIEPASTGPTEPPVEIDGPLRRPTADVATPRPGPNDRPADHGDDDHSDDDHSDDGGGPGRGAPVDEATGGLTVATTPEPEVEPVPEEPAEVGAAVAALAWLGWAAGAVVLVLLLAWLLSTCGPAGETDQQQATVINVGGADAPVADLAARTEGDLVTDADPSTEPAPAGPATTLVGSPVSSDEDGNERGTVTEAELQGAVDAILRDSGVTGVVVGELVTLTGTVADEATRDALEANVAVLLGVAAIDNRVTVADAEVPTEVPAGTDAAQTDAAQDAAAVDDSAAEDGADPTAPIDTTVPAGSTLNQALALAPVSFASGSADLTPEGLAVVAIVAAYLVEQPNLAVEIGGHTDDDGAEDANLELSQQRADAVRAALVDAGIAAERLTAVGFGESQPIVDNTNADNKALNRRIVFTVR